MIGGRKQKSFKDHLVSARIKCESSSDNKNAPCCKSRYQIYSFIEETNTFQLFIARIKLKRLTLEKGFWTVVAVWLFTWLSLNHVLSGMWVVLLHRSILIFRIIKKGLEKYQKFIPINVITAGIYPLVLVSLLLTLNIFRTLF